MNEERLISGHGHDTRIMIVDDYGTEEDYNNGRALTGYKERVLKELFSAAGWHLNETYRTLYIKDRLTYYGKAKKKKADAIAIAEKKQAWLEILKEEIKALEPNVIVPLGDLSLLRVGGVRSVEKFRGSVIPPVEDITKATERTIRVIPTLPPQILSFDHAARVYCRLDIEKAVRYKDATEPIQQREILWVCKNASELREYLNRARNGLFVTCDIESYGGIPTCIGFSHDGFEGVCVPLVDFRVGGLDHANTILIWQLIDKFLRDPSIRKVNQNIKYDQTVLERFGFKVNNIMFDTQIAAGCIFPEMRKNLGFLTSIYTDMPYFKHEGKEFDPSVHDVNRLYLYNAKDAVATWQICLKQSREIYELGLRRLFFGTYDVKDVEQSDNVIENPENIIPMKEPETDPIGMMKLYPIYQKMDRRGIRIDEEKRQKLIAKYSAELTVAELELKSLIEGELNPNSPKQVGAFIYEDLKFSAHRHQTDSGGMEYSTDEDTLEDLILNKPDNKAGAAGVQVLELILFMRKLYRVKQTLNIAIHPDGRMRQNSNLVGTETGRTSGGKCFDEILRVDPEKLEKGKISVIRVKLGHSLQTLGKHGFKFRGKTYGKDILEMFVPSHGCVFVEPDGSQAEARVDAVLADDIDILPRFDDGIGIHRLTGSWVFGCTPEEIKKGTEEYHISKTVRHAAERNIKAQHLSLMLHKPVKYCDQLLNTFHKFQPKIRAIFHGDIRSFVRKNLHLQCPNGRRRDFFGRLDEQLFNEAYSYLPQAIVSDQVKFSMIPFSEDDPDFAWLAEKHDGVLCELPKDQVLDFARRFKRIVERPIDFRFCSLSRDYELIIPAEVSVSETNWAELKEIEVDD